MKDMSDLVQEWQQMAQQIEHLSEVHRKGKQWYTHKNPYGCWICDANRLLRQILDTVTDVYLSPPIDSHDSRNRECLDSRNQEELHKTPDFERADGVDDRIPTELEDK